MICNIHNQSSRFCSCIPKEMKLNSINTTTNMKTTNEPEMPVCPYCKGNGVVGSLAEERRCPMCRGFGFLDHSKPAVPVKPAVSNEVRLSTAATLLTAIMSLSSAIYPEKYNERITDDAIKLADMLIEKIYGGKNE